MKYQLRCLSDNVMSLQFYFFCFLFEKKICYLFSFSIGCAQNRIHPLREGNQIPSENLIFFLSIERSWTSCQL